MNLIRLAWLSLICTLLVNYAQGSPLFGLFFGQRNSGHYRRPKSGFVDGGGGGGYNEYKRICSVINPNQYAFIGSNPYPAVPHCPY